MKKTMTILAINNDPGTGGGGGGGGSTGPTGGTAGNDVLNGSSAADTIRGGAGNDIISGNAGDDRLYGDDGNDSLYGGDGRDWLDGGSGADWMVGGQGDDTYWVDSPYDQVSEAYGAGIDAVVTSLTSYMMPANFEKLAYRGTANFKGTGSAYADVISSDAGNDTLLGLAGKDWLTGGSGDDLLDGGDQDDILQGETGRDQLYGGNGVDLLDGGAGPDLLMGGPGSDVYEGGEGSDVFMFDMSTVGSLEKVRDFEPGVDRLDFGLIDGRPAMAGDQPLAFAFQGGFVGGGQGSVRYEWAGDSTFLRVDGNGDGVLDFSVELVGQQIFVAMADLGL